MLRNINPLANLEGQITVGSNDYTSHFTGKQSLKTKWL